MSSTTADPAEVADSGPAKTASPPEAGASPPEAGASPPEAGAPPGAGQAETPGLPVDPVWARPALAVLLLGTAVMYLWNLSINGYGNTFYAAAVQAGTQSWKAFFFGSFDASNFITVDKPPVSLWIMALSGRIFGFSSWSMLAPEALLGVGSVALLYFAVRRVAGAPAGLLAGLGLALTPVAALMFRFNNPDAALVFFLVAAAYAMTRALEQARTRWLVLTGVLVGIAFTTKELQALLPVPGLALVYLVAAPAGLVKRIWQLLVGGLAMAVSGLWWFVTVDLIPAGSRPYVGGSTNNNVLSLALGSNGFGRLTGNEGVGGGSRTLSGGAAAAASSAGGQAPGAPGGFFGAGGLREGGGGISFSGSPGLGRLFNAEFGGFVAWLIPAAVIGLLLGLWLTRRAPRTDATRAALILWGGWFLATAAVFSFSKGIIHTYYGVALAPAVAVLSAIMLPALWRDRTTLPGRGRPGRVGRLRRLFGGVLLGRAALAVITGVTVATAFVLLGRASSWLPWLRWTILVAGLLAAVGFLVAGLLERRFGRRALGVLLVLGLVSALGGQAAWSLATVGSSRTGSVPGVGPAQAQQGPGAGGLQLRLPQGITLPRGLTPPAGGGLGLFNAEDSAVDPALTKLLKDGAPGYTWVAAASSSMTAGPLELASREAVMSLGGFSGSDPAITLAQFKHDVAAHKVHYYLTSSGGFGGAGGMGRMFGGGSGIEDWVSSSFASSSVGGYTVYDLTTPAAKG